MLKAHHFARVFEGPRQNLIGRGPIDQLQLDPIRRVRADFDLSSPPQFFDKPSVCLLYTSDAADE